MVSFVVFQQRVFKQFSPLRQLSFILLFAIFNFLKMWDFFMIFLFLTVKQFSEEGQRDTQSSRVKPQNFKYETVQTDVQEALNKILQFFVYFSSLSSKQLNGIWVMTLGQKIEEIILTVKDILEVVIKDYFIQALILDQFFQFMLNLSSIQNQIRLEYPKSFQFCQKQDNNIQKKNLNVKTLNFTNNGDFKKIEVVQHSLGMFLLQQILFQKLIKHKDCFVWELNQMIQQDVQM
ncbi:unnamed protein product [Paramecium primaurelia]|uniref:Transmembrane protein n=1 Tax=Paramecium primaurelia TaxID=5886 RepID=A0A8S1LZJ3_PARPR|nr:unnamed protein product [Paramecium primaurelia]